MTDLAREIDPQPAPQVDDPLITSAKRTLAIEAAGIGRLREHLGGALGGSFAAAIAAIRQASGRVILSGMGKSGQIARKISSTLSSTGTPAIFIHPSEASRRRVLP